jgi:hypothetical protein
VPKHESNTRGCVLVPGQCFAHSDGRTLFSSLTLCRRYSKLAFAFFFVGDMSNANRIGQNIVLSSVLAIFSYVPFEYVAKTTLLVSSVLFILDPIPPVTRLLSIIAAAIVLILSRIERHWREHHQASIEEQEEEDKSKDD